MAKKESEKELEVEVEQRDINYLASARDIAFVMAVFLYYMGWIYIYFYNYEFGLPIKLADLNFYNLLIYSSNVFIYSYNYGKIYLLLIIAIVLLFILWKRIGKIAYRFLPLVVLLLFPFIFAVTKYIAQKTAKQAIMEPAVYLKRIQFVFNNTVGEDLKTKQITDSLSKANDDEMRYVLYQNSICNFRLVAVTDNEYIVFAPGEPLTEKNYAAAVNKVYIIKKELVNYVTLTR